MAHLIPADLLRIIMPLVLIAVANYAVYSVLLRRKPAAVNPLVFLAATMAAGLLVLLPFWIYELAQGARIPTDAGSIAAVLYIGVFAFIIGNFQALATILLESFAGLGLKAAGSAMAIAAASGVPIQMGRSNEKPILLHSSTTEETMEILILPMPLTVLL